MNETHVAKVHRVTWWMAKYGGPTPKRHLAYSNTCHVKALDLGKLVGWTKLLKQREAAGEKVVKTVKKYHDKQGRLRYKGDVGLRTSESETYLFKLPRTHACNLNCH